MARPGFRLNRKVVGQMLKSAPVAAETVAAADKIKGRAGDNATIDEYTTDRAVAGIVVPAIDQARDGKLTKAVGSLGGNIT